MYTVWVPQAQTTCILLLTCKYLVYVLCQCKNQPSFATLHCMPIMSISFSECVCKKNMLQALLSIFFNKYTIFLACSMLSKASIYLL